MVKLYEDEKMYLVRAFKKESPEGVWHGDDQEAHELVEKGILNYVGGRNKVFEFTEKGRKVAEFLSEVETLVSRDL